MTSGTKFAISYNCSTTDEYTLLKVAISEMIAEVEDAHGVEAQDTAPLRQGKKQRSSRSSHHRIAATDHPDNATAWFQHCLIHHSNYENDLKG
jgi:hypothetical protein